MLIWVLGEIDYREALKKDKEYQRLLKQKKQKLSNKIKITVSEKKKYVLSTDVDFDILNKCKKLLKQNLTKEDRSLVKLIVSQLELDWRKPLVKAANDLYNRYKKRPNSNWV